MLLPTDPVLAALTRVSKLRADTDWETTLYLAWVRRRSESPASLARLASLAGLSVGAIVKRVPKPTEAELDAFAEARGLEGRRADAE